MPQANTTASLLCLKTEATMAALAGGLYQGLQRNGRTFGTAAAIEDNAGRGLTSVLNVEKAMPNTANTAVEAKIKYMIPRCDESATADVTFDCTIPAKDKPDYGFERFTFDDHVAEEFSMTAADFDLTCEGPNGELAKEVAYRAESMLTKYNRLLTAKLVARAGTIFGEADEANSTNVAPAKLKLFNLENGRSVPQPMGMYDLEYEYQRQNAGGAVRPVLIGGTKALGAYTASTALYGGNTEGLDPNDIRNALSGAYVDWTLPTTLAGSPALNPVISFLPDAVQLVEWFEFANPNKSIAAGGRTVWAPQPVTGSGQILRQVIDIGTPVYGRPFNVDVQIHFDECTNTVSYKMKKTFGLFTIPQAAFCGNHNTILLWDAVCEPYNCVDVLGEAPVQ